jgi:hypothetical protein
MDISNVSTSPMTQPARDAGMQKKLYTIPDGMSQTRKVEGSDEEGGGDWGDEDGDSAWRLPENKAHGGIR